MSIEELKRQEAALIQEVTEFEQSYKHRKPCKQYNKTGYCQHVELAERKRFEERNRQLITARMARACIDRYLSKKKKNGRSEGD